jgi:hypothetical protein
MRWVYFVVRFWVVGPAHPMCNMTSLNSLTIIWVSMSLSICMFVLSLYHHCSFSLWCFRLIPFTVCMAVQDRNLWNLASCILKIADEGFGECLGMTSHIRLHRLCMVSFSSSLCRVMSSRIFLRVPPLLLLPLPYATPRVLPFVIMAYHPINSYVTLVILLFSLSWLLEMQLTIVSLVCACLIYLC